MKMALHRRTVVLALLVLAAAGLVLAGCGDGAEVSSPAPDYAKKLAGAPAPLAALYKQGNELLPGGLEAFNDRIASLKGFPIVVNVWGSWCGPCRAEFPYFQKASAKYGERVAFLGVNSEDSDDFAKDFLADHPVPYPSYVDPDGTITDDVGGRQGLPKTVFYDADGNKTLVRSGGFTDQGSLEEAIEQYAIQGKSG